MFKYFLIISFLFYFFSCGYDSKTSNVKNDVDCTSEIRSDSSSKNKGVLKWNRKYLSRERFLPSSIIKYLAIGHEPFDSAVGDINGDKIPDIILVTSIISEDSIRVNSIVNDKNIRFDSLPLRRHLLVLTGQRDNSYKLELKNFNAIPCLDCCGMTDPFGGIAIKDGQIVITEYCASNCKGISEYRFKYLDFQKSWYLEKIIAESYCFNFQDYSLDTTTNQDFGKVSLKNFDINKVE